MIWTIGIIGLLIFTHICIELDSIKIELRHRNILLYEQNKILKDNGRIREHSKGKKA